MKCKRSGSTSSLRSGEIEARLPVSSLAASGASEWSRHLDQSDGGRGCESECESFEPAANKLTHKLAGTRKT